ncbi:MAG: hypothetical protein R3275_11430 [Saprospiraceae bacterium]|nr:hypothetical protein [Saprospiraceae bacterium]
MAGYLAQSHYQDQWWYADDQGEAIMSYLDKTRNLLLLMFLAALIFSLAGIFILKATLAVTFPIISTTTGMFIISLKVHWELGLLFERNVKDH